LLLLHQNLIGKELQGRVAHGDIIAWHTKDKIWKKKEAQEILDKTKGKDGIIDEVKRTTTKQPAPAPFDLTTLQTEAYRSLRIAPKETLEIAQELYSSGYTSYPRTSSQQLPKAIGFSKILKALEKQSEYKELCAELLKGELEPNNGKKTDPAHPAIFPTGNKPKAIADRKQSVYDLIVRRFLSTFGDPATRETSTITVTVEGEIFVAKGTRTLEPGWYVYYGRHVSVKDEEMVKVDKRESVNVDAIILHDKETQPPPRYTPSSIIKELEKRNLGTKATRAQVIDTLERRNYVEGRSIHATKLGTETIKTLEKYVPRILDDELTRHFEVEMEEIRENKKESDEVLEEARNLLTDIFVDFKKKEKEIGEGIYDSLRETEDKANTIGACTKCKDGTLMIKKGKYGKFISCNKYPDCDKTYALPSSSLIKPSGTVCDVCGEPEVIAIRKRKRPQTLCLNLDCPSKEMEVEGVGDKCTKCETGVMQIRKSLYGRFLGCNNFPKCRHIRRMKS